MQRQSHLVVDIDAGDQRPDVQLILQERELLCQTGPVQFGDEFLITGVVHGRNALRKIAAGKPFVKEFRTLLFYSGIPGPLNPAEDRILVDHVHTPDGRLLAPGETGIGIAMIHPATGELLPVFQRGIIQQEKDLRHLRRNRAAAVNPIPGTEGPAAVNIGGEIDAARLHHGDQPVQPVQFRRIEGQTVGSVPVEQFIVVMVNPDAVVPAVREVVGKFRQRLVIEKTRIET